MLCCLGEWRGPECTYDEKSAGGGYVSPYPGQRRLNANAFGDKAVNAGQTFQVDAPDGSRTVRATIPPGMSPEQTFLATFPLAPFGSTSNNNRSNDNNRGKIYTHDNTSTGSDSSGIHAAGPLPTPVPAPAIATPLMEVSAATNTKDKYTVPFSQALDIPVSSVTKKDPPGNKDQKLLLVNVPFGTPNGSTLYVKVPGENRTLAAKVPPGVSQFHVAYEPLPPRGHNAAVSPPIASLASASSPSAHLQENIHKIQIHPHNDCMNHSNANESEINQEGQQKLILVRVPEGIAPGNTLHVEVPDEPGRLLAARVPPNVREFQVAYTPRPLQAQRPQTEPQHAHPHLQFMPETYNKNTQGYGNHANYARSNAILPALGAMTLTAAGAMAYQQYHHHHHQRRQPYDSYGYGYVDGAGAGARDYGDAGAYDYDGFGAGDGYAGF